MEDITDFFKIITSILTKQQLPFDVEEDNFNYLLACRWLSFYSPEMAFYVNEYANKSVFDRLDVQPEELYRHLYAIIPKCKYKRIRYIKRKSTERMKKNGISEEDIHQLADYLEISTREVRKILANAKTDQNGVIMKT